MLSLSRSSVYWAGGDPAQSGLGNRHHLYPHGAWLRLFGGRRGLVQPASIGLAALDQHGRELCIEAVEEALGKDGALKIFNTDQSRQFTSMAFIGLLGDKGIAISMNGRGAWCDNVFVQRLWRSIKYEEVYLRVDDTVSDARSSIGKYLAFPNGRRPHSSLDRMTPDEAHFNALMPIPAAA